MRRNNTKRSLSLKECYEILNLPRDAGIDEVKRAYRKRAFELHPDLNPNDPNASKKFQLLNEAYVALSSVLQAEDAKAQKQRAKTAAREEAKKARQEEAARAKAQRDAEEKRKAQAKAEAEAKEAEQKKRDEASRAYEEQDVLRDLLNDPFARRVFEDIYSELNRQQAQKEEKKAPEPPKPEPQPKPQPKPKPEPPRQEPVQRPREKPKPQPTPTQMADPNQQEKGKGVGFMVKNWFRRQIDEEQTLYLPLSHLVAGRKVRLQISHGFSNEVQQIEVTLPRDFAIGKPIRLRGLGKHMGPWRGDLYLTLLQKT